MALPVGLVPRSAFQHPPRAVIPVQLSSREKLGAEGSWGSPGSPLPRAWLPELRRARVLALLDTARLRGISCCAHLQGCWALCSG